MNQSLTESGLKLNNDAIESLMKAYDSLSTFPDVTPALDALSKYSNVTGVVFSNGTDNMVHNSVKYSPDLAPHASVFSQLVTVEEVRKFKPSPEVYYHLAEKVGKGKSKEEMSEMWLVSGNPFDVVGSRASGMQAVWLDRGGKGWTDELVGEEKGRPTLIAHDLREVIDVILDHIAK